MSPLVSIIIPAYNVELYLSECLDSVIAQSYIYWELILVNDGSTDATPVICDSYALKDKRIHVTHKENTGVSDSRNKALEIATGKYIIFLDADDYWCDDSILGRMVKIVEDNDADIVRAEYKEVDAKGNTLDIADGLKKKAGITIDSLLFLKTILSGEYFLPLCLIKANKIGSLRFNMQKKYLEDAEFYLILLQQNLRCWYIPDVFYAYRKHCQSVTMDLNPSLWGNILDIVSLCFNLSDQAFDNKMKSFLLEEGLNFFFSNMHLISRYPLPLKKKILILRGYGIDDLYKEVQGRLNNKRINNKYGESCLTYKQLLIYYRYEYLLKRCGNKIISTVWQKNR